MPVDIPTPDAAARSACARLGVELPARLEGAGTRKTTPRSPLVVAWGDPPIVLRCGVPSPPGYDPKGGIGVVVDGVGWHQRVDGDVVRWTAVDRVAFVELAVPTSYDEHGTYLVDLAGPVKRAVPAR